MINNTFKEYLESKYSKEDNYKKILSKEKGVVSMKRKILNIAAIFLVIVIAGVLSTNIYAKIMWNIQFKDYRELPIKEMKGTLDELKEEGYAEVLNMDYLEQDGIGIKINSILLTDDCLDIDITSKFDENIDVNSQTFSIGYTIYDENKNIYQIHSRMHIGEESSKFDNVTLFTYEELGIEYNKKDVYAVQLSNNGGVTLKEVNKEERTINMNITLRARDKFPQSKKLYIQIFDPGFSMTELENENGTTNIINAEDFNLSSAKWLFEIDVPDKFYVRNTIELKPENEISGIEFEEITISETGMNLKFKSKQYDELISKGKDMEQKEFLEEVEKMLFVTDKAGNKFNELSVGSTEEKEVYKVNIDANIEDFNNGIYINYNNVKEKLVES